MIDRQTQQCSTSATVSKVGVLWFISNCWTYGSTESKIFIEM